MSSFAEVWYKRRKMAGEVIHGRAMKIEINGHVHGCQAAC